MDNESKQILQILKDNGIESLWHFTRIENLRLIKECNGLLSKKRLNERDLLEKVYFNGDSLSHYLDKREGNWNMVSLSFTPYNPMSYYKKKEHHLVFIEIDPKVATFDGVYFTDCNATCSGQKREMGIRGLNNVRFFYVKCKPRPYDYKWKRYVQAEVLVPDYIPLYYFKKIHFISPASLELGKHLWKEDSNIFTVTPNLFADCRYCEIDYPYVINVVTTCQEVNKENAFNFDDDDPLLMEGEVFWVKVYLYTKQNSKAKINIRSGNGNILYSVEETFDSSNLWSWHPSFRIPQNYRYSNIIIEVRLNDILWYISRRMVI
ncbi:MAG: DarT ssDNA thymidine ADP-ribosyltransferase family protein [Nitrososphaerota archaeon]